MIISLILSLVEVVHYNGLKSKVSNVSKIGIESAFADYNRILFEDYGILAIDSGYCSEQMDLDRVANRISVYLSDNLCVDGTSFFKANPSVPNIKEFGLLTDDNGAPFIKQAAKVAMYNMPSDLINGIESDLEGVNANELDSSKAEEMMTESTIKISEMENDENTEKQEIESPLSSEDQAMLEENGNPIDLAMEWKGKAVLSQVIEDVSTLSEKNIGTEIPSNRQFAINGSYTTNISSVEKILFTQYLGSKFSSYGDKKDHEGLEYEWEYVINGKNTDIKNLEGTVEKLIFFREIQNLITLAEDAARQQEALSIATAICATFAIPALITPIQAGIIAAWAYLESILDVRLLLSGGKVPIVKTPEQWTSNILMFPNYISPQVTANNVGQGLSYKDYLKAMTVIINTGLLGIRALDVVEYSIRENEDYVNSRVNNFLYKMEVSYEYKANPVFASLTPMLNGRLSNYQFNTTEEMSYI